MLRVRCWALFLSILLLAGCQSGFYQGPPSDHFNGRSFFNPKVYRYPAVVNVVNHNLNSQTQKSGNIKIVFVNHSTILIEANNFNLLTDPIWSYRASPFSWIGPARYHPSGIAFSQLPHIDAVLISHNHYDHLDIATIKQLNDTFHPVFIVPLGDKMYLAKNKIEHVVELDWWQSYRIKNTTITFLPAKHWSARWLTDVNKTLWGSYGVQINNRKIYFAGDSGYDGQYKLIHAKWGAPDLALLPIGAYEPRFVLKSVHFNPEDAVKASLDLQDQYTMAMHFGTFHLSTEPMDQPLKDLKKALLINNISNRQFFVLSAGDSWTLQ